MRWVEAGELQIDKWVRTAEGDLLQLVQRKELVGECKVYNLEVHDAHNYYVGEDEILVHKTLKPKRNLI